MPSQVGAFRTVVWDTGVKILARYKSSRFISGGISVAIFAGMEQMQGLKIFRETLLSI